MTKADLKKGMFVKLRNGLECLVCYDDMLTNIHTGEWVTSAFSYDKNLNDKDGETELDIIKVYNNIHSTKVLYERKEDTQDKLKQIYKMLGEIIDASVTQQN